jgi:membrane protease YdiL (CAAX protease family)
MSENDPASMQLPSTDLQLPSQESDGAAMAPPDSGLPTRSLVQEPRWPHPSFGWSLLWCLLMVFVTQVPGAVLIGVIAVFLAVLAPERFRPDFSDPKKLFESDAMNVALAIGFFFTELLVIGFSWLVTRLVVGRDWMRQLALRLPSLSHTLLALASFPALALLGNVAYELVRESKWVPSISDSNSLINLAFFWTAVFVVLGVAVLASWSLAGFGWTRKLAARPARTIDLLFATAALLVLVPCMLVLYQWLHRANPLSGRDMPPLGGMEEMGKIFGTWPLGFAVMVIGLGPGIGEELWCRGFLGRGLVGSHGAVLGVLASSFLFGLIHVDPCQGTMAMAMGIWLHFVYLCSRSLLLPMLLHFLNNSLSVTASHFSALHQLDAKPEAIPVSIYVTSLLLIAAAAYALYQSRAQLGAQTSEQILVWRPSYEGVEHPPVSSGTRVVHPLPSLAAAALVCGGLMLFVMACAAWFQEG